MNSSITETRGRRLVTKEELAKHLSIVPRTVDLWRAQRSLPVIKIGKSVRFDLDEIDRWIEDAREPQPSAA